MPERYCIREDYIHRDVAEQYVDTLADEYQNEVYEAARRIFDGNGLKSVMDLGCGSGYKLVKFFGDVLATGADIEPGLSALRSRYPGGRWVNANCVLGHYDMVICADVIEHLENPLSLIEKIKGMTPGVVVLSTPARDLMAEEYWTGPPRNPSHFREWSFDEFRLLIGQHFLVESHTITSPGQFTQMIVCC